MKKKFHFKVEIRKDCRICGGDLPSNRFRTFCSDQCRNKSYNQKYQEYRSDYQRARYDRLHAKRRPGTYQCKYCKGWYRQVGSHVVQRHEETAREYRQVNGYDVKRGLIGKDYREFKGTQAIENGTWKNLKKGKRYWFVKGDARAGRYKRSPQTMARLKSGWAYKSSVRWKKHKNRHETRKKV